MEDLCIVLLIFAVVWLISRQRGASAAQHRLEEIGDQLSRLESRLLTIERASRTTAPPPPTAAAPAPEPQKVQQRASFPAPPQPVPTAARVAVDPRFPGFTKPATSEPTAPSASTGPPPEPPPPFFSRTSIFTAPDTPAPRSMSLEERLGQNWLNKLGIVILVIGVALFLGYQVHNLGPLGKSSIGMTLSLALLAGGLLLERRDTYRLFARAAIGGGWALTFFVTFALYHVTAMQVLQSQALDLVLMFVVALGMVWHSLFYKSQVVTSLAFLLAFVTVGISEVTLFSLVAGALLATGLIYVAAREYWYELGLCGVIGVYVNHFLWLYRVLPAGPIPGHPFPEFLPSAALLLFYWLLFRLFYVLRVPKTQRQEVLASLTAVLNSVGVMSLLKYQSSHPEWAFFGLLALGTAEMVLAFVARRRFRTAFLVLSSIASVLLLAAIPFRFAGAHWSILWLLEAELLFVTGITLKETVFRRLGLLAGFVVSVQLIVTNIAPILSYRQSYPDAGHHLPVAVTLLCGALLFWFNAEFAPRRWPFIAAEEIDYGALSVTTYSAMVLAAFGLWVFFPGAWTVIAWLAATLLLGWIADRPSSTDLATEADLLAVAAIARIAYINFSLTAHWGPLSLRAISVLAAAALLYANMRRKARLGFISFNYVPAAYSWAATLLLGTLAWYELQPISIAVAWGIFGLVLFELGFNLRRDYLRHQGYALLGASFVRIFFANLNVGETTHFLSPRTYTVVPLIAAYFWVYQRLTSRPSPSRTEQTVAAIAAWAGLIAVAALTYFEVRPEWVTIAWALLALALLLLGWTLNRAVFVAQSLTLLLATAVRALMFNVFAPTSLAVTRFGSRVFCVSLACALMLAALPIAFQVRKQYATTRHNDWRDVTLFRPEQPFFFVPLVVVATLLAVELRAGMITIAWSALGVLVFLFALTVKERSYRLAGLSLLLLGVAKIITVDIWHATPVDRYITLIVMGAALLLVSFLYSRYKETLLKFL